LEAIYSERNAEMAKPNRSLVTAALILAITAIGATAVVVSVIRKEGEESRRAITSATGDAVAGTVEQTVEAVTQESKKVTDTLRETTKDVVTDIQEILTRTPSRDGSVTASRTDKPSDSNGPPIGAGDLFGELLKAGREITRSIDIAVQETLQLDANEERELGDQIHRLIASRQPLIKDNDLDKRLERLAEPFLRKRNRKDIEYTFHVVDDPEVNAFAHLGGFIYVNRGLLDFVNNQHELAFVLGHEIAHVDLRHCAQQMTYSARASQVAGETGANLVQLAYHTIALGYSEDKEFEADAWAYQMMGSTKQDAIQFLARLANHYGERDQGVETSRSAIDAIASEIDGHFATHPPTQLRIAALKRIAH
jgi:hypothetical protein